MGAPAIPDLSKFAIDVGGQSIAQKLFEAGRIESDLEGRLIDTGIDFSSLGWDFYDNSLEINGADPSDRLSDKAQQLIWNAGFSTVYLNHTDKWETHYQLSAKGIGRAGWRVSYPHKRGSEEKGIWVEKVPEAWPKEWFETGYAVVKEPNNEVQAS